ncbi:hypothetical protein [[Kitasatospora] papulosa]
MAALTAAYTTTQAHRRAAAHEFVAQDEEITHHLARRRYAAGTRPAPDGS